MRTGVVAVGHILLALHEVAAAALEYQLIVISLIILHHLGQGQRLVGEGLPDGRHELRVLSYCSKARRSYSSFNAETMRGFRI